MLVLHGYGSRRVNHADYCARLAQAGMSSLALDLRGHGDSGGLRDAGMVDDTLAALDLLAARGAGPLALRGSSMGGFLALHAAARHGGARAVVAICPASGTAMADRFPEMAWARTMALRDAVAGEDGVARGYWHARGDEVVPWERTAALHGLTRHPKHLRIVMGGDHRSLQHDPTVQRDTVTWLCEVLGG